MKSSKTSRMTLSSLGLLFVLLAALLPPAPLTANPSRQGRQPEIQIGKWVHTSVVDWQSGEVNGLLITNNAGGELRLNENQSAGSFTSAPFETPFATNAVGAVWRADSTEGTNITLELRGRSRPDASPSEDASDATGENAPASEAEWSEWQPLIAGDARSQSDDGAFATPDVLALSPDTHYLQLRVNFTSDVPRASAVLREVTIAYLNAFQAGPALPSGLQNVPIVSGVNTLTARPRLIPRSAWFTAQDVQVNMWENSPTPTQVMSTTWNPALPQMRFNRVPPRGIILHQIDATIGNSEILPYLRALGAYQIQMLGWDGMAYHYLIDTDGQLYEGRLGGPTSAVSRLSGGDDVVHVALLDDRDAALSEATRGTLVNLLAWLGQAYDIPPKGEHRVVMNDQRVTRQNIVGHNEAAPEAPDPGQPLLDLLPELRDQVDASVIRTRVYFAEGNLEAFNERLIFFNPGSSDTNATVRLFPENGAEQEDEAEPAGPRDPIVEVVSVPAGGRVELNLNEVAADSSALPAMVESSGAIIAERSMSLPADIDNSLGIATPSRVWYFAEGSTDDPFETYLVLFNPQTSPTSAEITYMQGDGTVATQDVQIAAGQRLVVTVSNHLPGVGFGSQIIANQPIVVERTMRFGSDGRGFHTAPGMSRLAQRWYFAEGTTAAPFRMRLLLLNPNQQTANVTVTFMTPDGTTLTLTRRYAVPPTTRLVVDANEIVPELGVATMVESDRPVAVERALYFTENTEAGETTAGTVTAGVMQPAYSWRFVDGRTTNARQFLLLSNPSRNQAVVTIEFILADGSSDTQTVVMPANSRYTAAVHELYPNQDAISMIVRSTQQIIAERSLFPNGQGGSTLPGIPGS